MISDPAFKRVRQTPAFIPWMATMAGTSTSCSVYDFDSIVRGHHVYKTIWTPVIYETLQVAREDMNEHDEYAVAITREDVLLGTYQGKFQEDAFFLTHGTIIAESLATERKELVWKYRVFTHLQAL